MLPAVDFIARVQTEKMRPKEVNSSKGRKYEKKFERSPNIVMGLKNTAAELKSTIEGINNNKKPKKQKQTQPE